MITGLFLDGWAHGASKPETFFSPWHGVLYSGFAVAMIYTAIDGYRLRRRGEPVAMEPYMVAGIVFFSLAGVGDMLWHQVFGIEVGVEALLSPSHLALMIGGVLLATFPLRLAWSDPDGAFRTRSFGAFFPTVVSVSLATALVSFFTMYVSAFAVSRFAGGSDPEFGLEAMHGAGAILFSNLLFMIPLLLVLRRWTPPAGTFTFLFGVVLLAMTGLDGFARIPLVIPALIGGAVADVLVRRLVPSSENARAIRVVASVTPLALWAAFFAVTSRMGDLGWQPELWSGAIVLCVLSGFGLSLLVVPPAIPVPEAQSPRSPLAVS
jgi:hypothetical protein